MTYLDSNNNVRFGIQRNKLSGTAILVQKVLIGLFTIKNSNTFLPSKGSVFLQIIGNNKIEVEEVRTAISMSLDEIKVNLFNEQATKTNIPSDEKLTDLFLEDVVYKSDTQSWNAIIKIKTLSSNSSFNISSKF